MGRLGCGCLLLPPVPPAVLVGLMLTAAGVERLNATDAGRVVLGYTILAVLLVLALVVLGLVYGAVRGVWAVVGGPLGAGFAVLTRGGAVRPSSHPGASLGTVPGTAHPIGVSTVPGMSLGRPAGNVGDADRDGRGRRWLVQGIVPYGPRGTRRQYITGIAAKRGTGKSFLLLDLSIALLSGQPWLGWPLRHCASVLYVDLELDEETFAERAEWLARGRRLGTVPTGLHYMDLSGETLHVPTAEALTHARELRHARWGGWGAVADALAVWGRALGIEHPLTLWGATTQERIVLRARRVKAQAILVDSLTLGGGTANGDDDGWRRLLKGMEFWGAPVVTLDHSTETGKLAMMGNMAKEGLVRSVLLLTRQGRGRLLVTHHKANFAEGEEPFVATDAFHKDAAGRLIAVTFTRAAAGPADPDSRPSPTPTPSRPAPLPLPPGAPAAPTAPSAATADRLLAQALPEGAGAA